MQSENGILLLFYIFLNHGNETKNKNEKGGCCVLSTSRGCHTERGWNQQIMMLENGRFYHSMYLGIL